MRKSALSALALAVSALTLTTGAQVNTAAAQQAQAQTYTDAQLQAYVAASREIEPISNRIAQMTPEERTQATAQITAILRRHDLTGDVYNGIETQARTDDALAQRLAALQLQNLSDDMLRRFAAAATEIDPITRGLGADATDAQRAQAATQIRAVLDRHNLTVAAYNAIATRAQADQALAARIAQARSGGGGEAED